MNSYNTGTKEYLELLEAAKSKVTIPIIASLNGASVGGWTSYAKSIVDAGADAMELNIYFIPTDLEMTSSRCREEICGTGGGRQGHHLGAAGGQDRTLFHLHARTAETNR